jgi:hypothetical protein
VEANMMLTTAVVAIATSVLRTMIFMVFSLNSFPHRLVFR